jgi:hypothetical protein
MVAERTMKFRSFSLLNVSRLAERLKDVLWICLLWLNGRFHVRLSYTASLDTLKIALEKIKDAVLKLTTV